MGTLENQPERSYFEAANEGDYLKSTLTPYAYERITVRDLIEAKKALEMHRANDIAVQDGDYRDEHAAGYAEKLDQIASGLGDIVEVAKANHRIAEALERIADALEKKCDTRI
jgi:hypothetical protein